MQKALRMRLKNTCGVHTYSPIAAAGAPRSRCRARLRGFTWVHSRLLAELPNNYSAPASEQTFTSSPIPSMRVRTVCPGFNH